MEKKIWTHLFALFVSTQLFSLDFALAQKIRVKKVKGQNALIETSIPLEEGKTYQLKEDPVSSNVNYSLDGLKSRKNSLTLGATMHFLTGPSVSDNSFSVQGRYGWNFSHLEFGMVGDLRYRDQGGGGITNFAFGGYFDYNLVTNRDGKSLVYGPFGLLTMGTLQQNKGSTNIMDINGGGFVSFFLGQSSTAIRVEGYIDLQQINAATGTTNLTGAGSRALIVHYF